MAETQTQMGGLENILAGASAAGGAAAGHMLSSAFGFGPLVDFALTAGGLAAGGLVAAPLLYSLLPGKSVFNAQVDPLYGALGGAGAATAAALAAYTALAATPIGWIGAAAYAALYAIPAYFMGKGVVGGYFKPLLDGVASVFKGATNYGGKTATGLRDMGTGISDWVRRGADGFRSLGEGIYNRARDFYNYWRNFGRPTPARAGGHP